MPTRAPGGTRRFHNKDMVLDVSSSVDRSRWDESKYEGFIDELCDDREYQKDAIRVALRYLLGGEYRDLLDLASKSFETNPALKEKYGSRENLRRHLQIPDKLSAALDLATGTGKSYVIYGIAAIMLAEGAVDRVLVICPSTTIERGLIEKFKLLAGNADLRDLLPAGAKISAPRVINAAESIVGGSICIENYHAILKHVRSSIRDSLKGKGARTLILNDEAHHVVNESSGQIKRWKEFLTDTNFSFRYIIGVSGTCYVGNEYFSDVIYRYSLRTAMEQGFIKKVKYVAEMPKDTRRQEEKKWKMILNRHEEIRRKLSARGIRPLTIIVTRDIRSCNDIADKFKAFLVEETGKSREQINERVLVIHSEAADLPKLDSVNNAGSQVEWILSVSMLNEGWDVKRVFQIVPHEKKAFESKLLIAQVLGRGLRVPDGWRGEQPEVIVFNHDNWAADIRHLVAEVMESENIIPTFPLSGSPFNFDILNIKYDPKPYYKKTYPMKNKYNMFEKGYVDMELGAATEEVKVEFEEAGTGSRSTWKTKIKNKTYSPKKIAEEMFSRFGDLEDAADQTYYEKKYPLEALESIVLKSLKKTKNKFITESMKQKFLQAMGTLQRKAAQVVRYDFEPKEYFYVSTTSRPQESATASGLKNGHTLFYSSKTAATIADEDKEFYEKATESASGYKCALVPNGYDFKTPLNAALANHDNERRFIKELISLENTPHIEAWIKSTSMGFYDIEYFWRKGEHPKRGRFNPDFFIKLKGIISIVEIKDDDEIREPSEENKKKNKYALEHIKRINKHLSKGGGKTIYKFNFLTPSYYSRYFQCVREGNILDFRSSLDVALVE